MTRGPGKHRGEMPGMELTMVNFHTPLLDRLRGMSIVGFDEEPDLTELEGLTPEELKSLTDLSEEDRGKLSDLVEEGEHDSAIEKLKEALRKERQERRRLAKELKAAGVKPPAPAPTKPSGKGGKDKDDDEEGGPGDKAHEEALQKERQRSERLAERLATNAIDTAILKVLGSDKKMPKFQDTDDVLRLLNRDDIDFEQDDDAPEKVTVDEDTIKDALKRLGKAKPHLLAKEKTEGGEGEGQGGSGSKFGGQRQGSEKDRKAALEAKYPALTRR